MARKTFLQKVVKNEAMKNDPPEIYGKVQWPSMYYMSTDYKEAGVCLHWHAQLVLAGCYSGGVCLAPTLQIPSDVKTDIGSIGGIIVMEAFLKKYNITPATTASLTSNIVSTLQAGCFFGSLIAYYVADRWGRKPSLLIAAGVTILGIIIQSSSDGHISALYVGRLVSGFGVGAASMLTPLYVSENAPRAIRGGLTGLYQLFIAAGTMLSFWVNYGTHNNFKPVTTNNATWQMELDEMRDQLENERRLVGGASFMDLQREMWTIKGNRNRALISIGLMVCQQMTGTNAINYYAPTIFLDLGIPSSNTGLFATGIYGVVKMVTCAAFLLFAADSLGRRKSLLWTSIAQGLSMFVIGFYVRFDPPIKNAAIPPVGYFALTCIFLFAAFFQFGWGPCCWIIVSEIPTARLRAMNVAIAAATQWLFNFVVAQAVPHMLVTVGKAGYGTYFIFGSFCFSMFLFVWFFIPETKGMSLERMDDMFGVTEMVKGQDEEHGTAEHIEKGPNTEVQESTADAARTVAPTTANEKEVQV
ncbi:hypothetical protein EG329_006922 [Mollisiaceae sp. DMI_Dod_QoI]|nr:hypothetical protein EG329_006922 [Helotiales sp. DMI_Dod_QoI]